MTACEALQIDAVLLRDLEIYTLVPRFLFVDFLYLYRKPY